MSLGEREEEPKGQRRNGCDMSHEIEIKSRARAGLQWSTLVRVFWGVCIEDVALGNVLLVKRRDAL